MNWLKHIGSFEIHVTSYGSTQKRGNLLELLEQRTINRLEMWLALVQKKVPSMMWIYNVFSTNVMKPKLCGMFVNTTKLNFWKNEITTGVLETIVEF